MISNICCQSFGCIGYLNTKYLLWASAHICIGEEHTYNIKGNRNILNHKSLITKGDWKGLQNTKFYAAFLISVIFAGIFSLSPAFSSLMSGVVVGSTGQISTGAYAYANSGSASDIQAAVDWVAGHGGTGNVYIPEGTFNFVEVGEDWQTVYVPAGVNIFGATTDKYANGSVVSWNTILVMVNDVPGSDSVGIPTWFEFYGTGDVNEPSRFSDIMLQGYRANHPSSTGMHNSIVVNGVVDFRIDHCYFLDCTAGIYLFAASKNGICRGVIDHNRLVNTVGDPGYGVYADRTIDYGIMPYRTADSDYWDSNILNVLGRYTDYSVYIEDNYFSRWRHDVSSINGMHFVFRYNVVEDDYAQGTVDGHGTYTNVGTRAMEFYGNQFLDPNYIYETQPNVVNWRGGGGVFFNNTIRDYYFTVYFRNEGSVTKCYPGSSDCPIYFWGNTYLHGGTHYDQPQLFQSGDTPGSNVYQGVAMPNYTPYAYPHPLTLM